MARTFLLMRFVTGTADTSGRELTGVREIREDHREGPEEGSRRTSEDYGVLDSLEEIMRQLRRGAPFGWLLALLFPLLVSGGLGGGGGAALLQHTTVTKAGGEHHPLSRQVSAGGQRHAFTATFTGTGTGAGGGHPFATRPSDARHLFLAPGFDSRPAGDDDPRPLAALLVRPGRAPPSTGS